MSSWSLPTGTSKRQRLASVYTRQLYCNWSWRYWCTVRAISAPRVVCHVCGCPKRTSSVVPCPGSHQLRALRDMVELTCDNDTPWNSSGIPSCEFHGPGDEQAVTITVNKAHEQNNAAIKGDGGAVGLTDNPSARRRWMVAGLEVVRLIEEFQDAIKPDNWSQDTKHHDQWASLQTAFRTNVGLQSVIRMMEDFRNSFQEDSQNLLVLDTKEIAAPPGGVDALRRVHTKWVRCSLTTLSQNAWWRERNPQKMPSTETSSKSSVSFKTSGKWQAANAILQE